MSSSTSSLLRVGGRRYREVVKREGVKVVVLDKCSKAPPSFLFSLEDTGLAENMLMNICVLFSSQPLFWDHLIIRSDRVVSVPNPGSTYVK